MTVDIYLKHQYDEKISPSMDQHTTLFFLQRKNKRKNAPLQIFSVVHLPSTTSGNGQPLPHSPTPRHQKPTKKNKMPNGGPIEQQLHFL